MQSQSTTSNQGALQPTGGNYQTYGLKIGFPPGSSMKYKIMRFNDYNITIREAIQYITSKQNMQKPEQYCLQITYIDPNSSTGVSNTAINQETSLAGSVGDGSSDSAASLSRSSSGGIMNNKKLKWMDDNDKLTSYPLSAIDVVLELKKKYQLVKVYDRYQSQSLIVDVTKPLSNLMDLILCKFKSLSDNSDYRLYNSSRELDLHNNIKVLNVDTSLPFILKDINDPNSISEDTLQLDHESDDDDDDNIHGLNLDIPAKSIINPLREGFLKKQNRKKAWNSRYFKLTDKHLYYYKTPNSTKASGIINYKDHFIRLANQGKDIRIELIPKVSNQSHHSTASSSTHTHPGSYLLKFDSDAELKSWLIQPFVLDAATSGPNTPSTTPNNSRFKSKLVFGQPLDRAVLPGMDIPLIVSQTIEYIEKKAMDTVGIFRLSGSVLTIEQWKAKYDKGEKVDLSTESDPHAIAGLLKLYLRELPDPILTFEKYNNFIAAQSVDDFPSRIKLIKHLVKSLPAANYAVLSHLMQFLGKVATHSANNKMMIHNLSTVFGPNLIKEKQTQAGSENVQTLVEDTPIINALTLSLIRDYQYIFGDKEVPEQKILARTLYDYEGTENADDDDKDLVFAKGVVIKVTQQGSDGWWTGEYQGKTGKFPASYVEVMTQSPSSSMLIRTKSNSNISKKKKFLLEMESARVKVTENEKDGAQLQKNKDKLVAHMKQLEAQKAQLVADPEIKALLTIIGGAAKSVQDIGIIPINIETLVNRYEEYKKSHEELCACKNSLSEEFEAFTNNPKKKIIEGKDKEQLQQKYDSLYNCLEKSQKIRQKSISWKKVINEDLDEIKKMLNVSSSTNV
ncbi:hypothetical protein CYY_006213 [Polysphondylium violaceum]|uniref:Pleckstrin domain-containing protein n=1 Tax=Polysphondylium violaceum TaxID=133409 RepID=A0A8J4URN3_9MYCE|nr:hypothetical protein CYY_006213 [Polysphondylium violaceum]